MQEPIIPDNETARLQSLYALNLLDSESEERFDRITRLAKKLFDVPIALISLVDENRQWFKSKQGLNASETSRDISFCGHAILDKKILCIENALEDSRFADNPLVTGDPKINFYAGCPLSTPDGAQIGTLCIIDRRPRRLSEDDLALLSDLAKMIEEELKVIASSITDELTGISNRRGFNQISAYLLKMCERINKPMSLLAIDLDDFKPINDKFGHAEGDRVLKDMSKILINTFRDSDVVARVGGDEFCVLCSSAGDDEISVLIERLQRNVDRYNQNIKLDYAVKYSIGSVAFDPKVQRKLDEILQKADEKMYQSKSKKKTTVK